MTDLPQLVQALPQKLYDEIYELTFALIHSEHYITNDYKPPSCLQVSHITRLRLKQSYYGSNSIFYATKRNCEGWVASISYSDRLDLALHAEVRILDMIVRPSRTITDTYILASIDRQSMVWSGSIPCKFEGVYFPHLKAKIIDDLDGKKYWVSAREVRHRR